MKSYKFRLYVCVYVVLSYLILANTRKKILSVYERIYTEKLLDVKIKNIRKRIQYREVDVSKFHSQEESYFMYCL